MTVGEVEEKQVGLKTGGEDRRLSPSVTTLSTIAVQAGQSLIVVSVLKKHEQEVLSVVGKTERRKQKRSRKQEEEEEEVHKAMTASLKEGWSLLLCLLERREEVLKLAAEFYSRAKEFEASINSVEEMLITADSNRLTEVKLTYDSTRKELLGKSLQVLTSSSVLLLKLRKLQRTEALQRRGGVLQDEGDEEEEEMESSQLRGGTALRLEELVEMLQDRRRRADQAVKLQLHQLENLNMVHEEEQESRETSLEDLRLTEDEILDQDQQFEPETEETPDLRLESRNKETKELNSRSTSDENSRSRTEQTNNQEPESSSDLIFRSRLKETKTLQPESRSELQPGSRSDLPLVPVCTRNLKPGETVDLPYRSKPDLLLNSRSEETKTYKLGLRSGAQPESALKLEETKDSIESDSGPKSGSKSDVQPGFDPKLNSETRPEETKTTLDGLKLNLKVGSTSGHVPGPNKQQGTRLEVEPGSRLKEIKTLQFGIKLNLNAGHRPEETRDTESGIRSEEIEKKGSRSVQNPQSRVDLKPGSGLEETKDFQAVCEMDLSTGSRSEETESGLSLDVKPDLRSNLKPGSKPEETLVLPSVSRPDLESQPRSAETRQIQIDSKVDLWLVSRSDLEPVPKQDEIRTVSGSTSVENKDLELGSRSDLEQQSRLAHSKDQEPGLKSGSLTKHQVPESKPVLQPPPKPDLHPPSGLELKLGSRLTETKNLQSGVKPNLKVEPKTDHMPDSRSDMHGSRSDEKPVTGSESKPVSRVDETSNLQSGFRINLKAGYRPDLKAEETRDLEPGIRSETKSSDAGYKPELKTESRPGSESEETQVKSETQPGSRVVLKPKFREYFKPGSKSEETLDQPETLSDVQPESDLVENPEPQLGETRNLQAGSESEEDEDLCSGSGSEDEDLHMSERKTDQQESVSATSSGQPEEETQSEEEHTNQSLLTNQRQQLVSSCEHLADKIWGWVQQSSSDLSDSTEAGQQLSEAEESLNTHLQLLAQAESAGQDAETMTQILDQMRTDQTSRISLQPPREPNSQLSPLKALTEQLKRGSTGRLMETDTAQPSLPAANLTGSPSPELADRVDLVLKELLSLNRKIDSHLQLLQPYVAFLRAAQQVEEEMEEMMKICKMSPEKQEEKTGSCSSRKTHFSAQPVKKEQLDAMWQETLQRFFTCQELGKNFVNSVSQVSGAGLNVQAMVSLVQQTLEQLCRNQQEVNELLSEQQTQIQEQQEAYCRRYQERFLKTLQDLKCVSELLDSCTQMDLGSDLHTTKLLEHFKQAKPHFKKLDTEVEYVMKNWGTLKGVQTVKEEDLSELLKLQETVKTKIQQSESILDLTGSFHLTSRQLEALLESDKDSPLTVPTGLCGWSEAEMSQQREKQQRVQSLLKTASTLKTDICTSANQKGCTCFRVEQLEARFLSLDSLCASWLNEARQREQNQLLTRQLNNDINQLRDAFKELKKRFSNLKFNYMKRNDRTRNMKAVRNQLQQVETYEEKLLALRKRLQGVTARLGLEVKDGGVAREAEDAINELQRQMGEFERGVSEHQKTLEMTCKLQQAMEEYQFWCEEASATIARVGKFSSECRSTEAVAVLYQQFEKFVWPTVPQQEERISQISELAVRLHGVEEGQRYIEKTVSKHSEMVESIRELSDGLMELEAKLKMENLKQQQNKEKKENNEEGKMERRKENEVEDKDEEKEKGNRKSRKKQQRDNRSSQETAEMYELKETGHTPELTAEHDGKEVPVKRQTAANRKPPLKKSRSLDTDTPTISSESINKHAHNEKSTSSYCSSHTFSFSCSPIGANRRIHTIHNQSKPVSATPPLPMTCPSFSDIQKEFQSKEKQETRSHQLQDASAEGLSEAELQQQEEMTEESLSNDEYDCASPDDISLPPLAETPESIMIQSDIEDGVCFSSHSVHTNQYSQQHHAQSDHTGPTPPTSHNSTRLRSESSLFVQSLLTVPTSSPLTSNQSSILVTGETSTTNNPQSADCSLRGHEPSLPPESNPVHENGTPDTFSTLNNNPPERKTSIEMKEHNTTCNQPQRTMGNWGKITQNTATKGETLLQMDPVLKTAKPFRGSRNVSNISTVSQQKIHCQSSSLESRNTLSQACSHPISAQERPISKSKKISNVDQVSHAGGSAEIPSFEDSGLNKASILPGNIRLSESSEMRVQTSATLTQDSNLSESSQVSMSGPDQDVTSREFSKKTSSVSLPQGSTLTTTTTVIQQTVHSRSLTPKGHCAVAEINSKMKSKQKSPLSQGSGSPPEVRPMVTPEPDIFSNISASSSFTSSSDEHSRKQSHQTVHTLQGSTCTQPSVHDPGMTPSSSAKPVAPLQPEAQTPALAKQANPHVTPLSSPPHLLTSDQDPNICQPMAIREEIKLTPQIQGPSLPAPLPQAQTESLPQGKASKTGPPCFTRPLSRATVMEGSPVTLEVEVTGHPEPALSWFKEGEVAAPDPGRSLFHEEGKHVLCIPEVSDSDGRSKEAWAAKHQESLQPAGNSSSGDEWLVTEVFNIISVDWHSWFGTLCVLLWLLYLILL
ncbi:uncharacterized protein ccdc141 [Halichoeres trimaculatus]|uniref:uncharacterized protein ccdc141 n=1 Tax=Halichoeres trimaculatus TaxID=147232 RepID=UPI003D9EC286